MIQKQFADRITEIVKTDSTVIGLAVAGSWLTNEIDEYSDLDLVLVTKEKITGDKNRMIDYAEGFGELLVAFTGEHVGEPRLLICLYDDPFLHVDIKFVTLDEFHARIENPFIPFDADGQLHKVIQSSEARYPYPDYQWIEDRFWVWIHYALAKIGRGEFFDTLDFLSSLRIIVLGPLMLIKNGNLPKGVRKLEMQLSPGDLNLLRLTVADYSRPSLIESVENSVGIYRELRKKLFNNDIVLRKTAEDRVMEYLNKIKSINL